MDIQGYLIIKDNLEKAQAAELEARLALVAKSGHKAVGSKTIAMDGGKVQVTNTINYTVDMTALPEVKKRLANDVLFYQVFVPKPQVSATALKSLTADQLEIVNEAIISKAGTPQFKVVKAPGDEE